jgi:hypothetical protein
MLITIITPTLRPDMAQRTAQSVRVAAERAGPTVAVNHLLAHWTAPPDPSRITVAPWLTALITNAPSGWLMFCDDDNLLHPDVLCRLAEVVSEPNVAAVVFDQQRPDMPGGILSAKLPPAPTQIDGGQVALFQGYARQVPWQPGPVGDGLYLQTLYALSPPVWRCVNEPLTYHNAQRWLP